MTVRYHYDARDGRAYKCVLMPDGKWWSAENLAWAGAGVNYNNDPAIGAIYGRLYTKAERGTAAPQGAHCATAAEWWNPGGLVPSCGGALAAGKKLKAASPLWSTNTGTDDYGFAILPGGHYNSGSWLNLGFRSIFGTTDASTGNTTEFDIQATSDRVYVFGPSAGTNTTPMYVRFIVDTFIDPPSLALFGAPFDGFDRGTTVTIDRNIVVVDTLGGPPRLIERGPSSGALDRWTVSTTFAVPYDKAQAIQAAVPPYGTDTTAEINLPPRSGGSSFPGLGPASSGATFDTYAGVAVRTFESKGQMGVRVDLYGFGIEFDLFCTTTGGGAINSAAAPTVTVPAFVARKFRAHQLNDFSKVQYAVSGGGVLAANSAKIKAGRRKDLNVALDHLTPDEADQLVALFRGVRTGTVTLPFDSDGRPGSGTFLLTGLSFQRQALFWDAKLEVSAA